MPEFCRAEAFELFAEQLASLEETHCLVTAAIAVSMHALDDVQPDDIHLQLDALADRVRSRWHSDNQRAGVAHLHHVLFDEERFRGNTEDYYTPLNSYLSTVLESKQGIPISLTLIYKAVADRLNLQVEGVNAPGHFLARVEADGDTMIVDPFFDGQLLTPREAIKRIRQVTQREVPGGEAYFVPATHRQWLARMLRNLQHVFSVNRRKTDLAAMGEFLSLLESS